MWPESLAVFSLCLSFFLSLYSLSRVRPCRWPLQVLALLESRLLQVGRSGAEEAAVFYLKMTADYYRYMSEFKPKAHGVAASTANSEVWMVFSYFLALSLSPHSLLLLLLSLSLFSCVAL